MKQHPPVKPRGSLCFFGASMVALFGAVLRIAAHASPVQHRLDAITLVLLLAGTAVAGAAFWAMIRQERTPK